VHYFANAEQLLADFPAVAMLVASRFVSPWRYLFLVAVAFAGASARAVEYRPLDVINRKPVEAAFKSADSGGNWTFSVKPRRDGGAALSETVPAADVVSWGAFRDFQPGHRLRLVSGGEIVGYQIEVGGDRVTLESDLIDAVEIPLSDVAALIFDPPNALDANLAAEWNAAELKDNQHALFLTNGDRLTGSLVSIAGGKVEFQSAGKTVALDRTKVATVVLNTQSEATRDGGGIQTWVGLSDGSRLLATSLESREKTLQLALGDEVQIGVPAEAVVAIQPLGGRTVYLSDLKPAGYRHVPFLQLPWSYERDRNVVGAPLRAAGRLYLKGIGMHSASRITYDLDGNYESFAADLAIDDATRGKGSVACRVFIDDGSGDWQLKFESSVIRGGQQPAPVEVNVAGAKRISLLVEFADRGDEQDHVDWLNARLVKKP
jgi:hypothetical protein